MTESFLKLSQVLTGFENLRSEIASEYLNILQKTDGIILNHLISVFDDKVKGNQNDLEALVNQFIWSDLALREICQSIILLWYTASLTKDPAKLWLAPPNVYYEALLWKAIEAHPPALSGGYFGYWRYAPEN